MKRGSGGAGNDANVCVSGLLLLPPELRLWEFLDGGGIGGTQDLYSLSVAHRALAHNAGLATRLDDVDDVRLASLLSAFERDRQHRTATAAAASTPSPPLTRAPVNLKYLAFGKGLGWEEDDQAMCEWLAQEAARADSGLAGLEVLDLSATCMHDYELYRVVRALGQQGAQSQLAVLHAPLVATRDIGVCTILPHLDFARLTRLTEIHHATGAPSTFFGPVLDLAVFCPEATSRLTTLALAGQYTGAHVRRPGVPRQRNSLLSHGILDDTVLRRYELLLKPGCFANLRVLRLEAPEEHVRNKLTALGINCLGDWWCRGVFGPLEEFSFRGHLRDKNSTLMEALLFNWRKAPAAIFANLQVLRLQGFFGNFGETVALFDFFAETAGHGLWDRLRVLDLSDCSINDIAMGQLAAAMEAGFGSALEELDLSNSAENSVGDLRAEGVRFLCTGLQANERTHLKRLKLNDHPLDDDGLAEIVAAWREGNGALDALEELSVKRCDLTDDSVVEMVKAGFLGHQPALFGVDGVDGADGASEPGTPPPPARLRRLSLGGNFVRGENRALPQLLALGGSTSTLTRLDLNHNWGIDAEGLRSLLGLLGGGLRELKVGCGWAGQEPSRGDAMLRVVLELAAPASPVLRDLRRLDIRHLNISSANTTELAAGLREGRFLRKLCQLELACSEVGGEGRAREAAARMRRELIDSRRPMVFDVLTINRRGWL